MKKITIIALVTCAVLFLGRPSPSISQETQVQPKDTVVQPIFEYASVRFMGADTSIVWPDGSVDKVLALSGTKMHSKEADPRMYWLTVAMNIMGKRGFRFVGMSGDRADVFMMREVKK